MNVEGNRYLGERNDVTYKDSVQSAYVTWQNSVSGNIGLLIFLEWQATSPHPFLSFPLSFSSFVWFALLGCSLETVSNSSLVRSVPAYSRDRTWNVSSPICRYEPPGARRDNRSPVRQDLHLAAFQGSKSCMDWELKPSHFPFSIQTGHLPRQSRCLQKRYWRKQRPHYRICPRRRCVHYQHRMRTDQHCAHGTLHYDPCMQDC